MRRFSGFLVVLMAFILISCDLQPLSTSDTLLTPTSSSTPRPTLTSSSPLVTPTASVTATPTVAGMNCTYTQGYWKNHPLAWPVIELVLGGVTYSQEEVMVILRTPPRGDATYILAHQLVAAKLNVSNGADETAIAVTIAAADGWLIAHPLGSNPSGAERDEGLALASTLDDYNSGLIGPGRCDDATPTPTITPTATVTATVTATSTPTATPTISATITATPRPTLTLPATGCTGADPHPQGTELANRYGVAYEEIMEWFCSGFGFGEIERAYDLSLETGTPVNEIFALRQSGLGWGQIREQLGASGKKKDK